MLLNVSAASRPLNTSCLFISGAAAPEVASVDITSSPTSSQTDTSSSALSQSRCDDALISLYAGARRAIDNAMPREINAISNET